jgi:glycosyltransferase involved in cell wall biosynthesis
MVLPSFAEGLPVAVMEAMAMGRPVISTYIGGIPELVEPGVSGWLVPAGSVEALTQAMQDALTADPADLEAMGGRGALRVAVEHDIDQEAERLVKLFRGEDVADAKPVSGPGKVVASPLRVATAPTR